MAEEQEIREDFSEIKVAVLPGGKAPSRIGRAAGYDLFARIDREVEDSVNREGQWAIYIPSGGRKFVPCGIKLELSENMEGQIRSKSGLAKRHGLKVLNSPGTVDEDFRGEIGALIHNTDVLGYWVMNEQAIAQIVFSDVFHPEFVYTEVAELSETERGESGFGEMTEKTYGT